MFLRCILVSVVLMTVNGLPPFRRPTGPRSVTSLTRENLRDPSPWIKLNQFGNVLSQFPAIVSDIAEAGPKIESDSQKLQVIINVKDYKKENLKSQIKGDFLIIKGSNVNNTKSSSSLISEFSQIYSLPIRANPSYVTGVLTTDGYLVLRAPLGSAVKKNNVEKDIAITESDEPLHTQKVFIRPNNVPVIPLYKLVKTENMDSVTEVPQNYVESSKKIFEKKQPFVLPNLPIFKEYNKFTVSAFAPVPTQKSIIMINKDKPIIEETPQIFKTKITSTEISLTTTTTPELKSSLENQNVETTPPFESESSQNNFNKSKQEETDINTTQNSSENYDLTTVIEDVREKISNDVGLVSEVIILPENKMFEPIQETGEETSSITQNLEVSNYETNKIISETEKSPVTENLISISDKYPKSLNIDQVISNERTTSNTDTSTSNLIEDQSLLITTNQPDIQSILESVNTLKETIPDSDITLHETERDQLEPQTISFIGEISEDKKVSETVPRVEESIPVTTNQPQVQENSLSEVISKDDIAASETDSVREQSISDTFNQSEVKDVTSNEDESIDTITVTENISIKDESLLTIPSQAASSDWSILPQIEATTSINEITIGNTAVDEEYSIAKQTVSEPVNKFVDTEKSSTIFPESSAIELTEEIIAVSEANLPIDQSLPTKANEEPYTNSPVVVETQEKELNKEIINDVITNDKVDSVVDQYLPSVFSPPANSEINFPFNPEIQSVASNQEESNDNSATSEAGFILDQVSPDGTTQANGDAFPSALPVVQAIVINEGTSNIDAVSETLDQILLTTTNQPTTITEAYSPILLEEINVSPNKEEPLGLVEAGSKMDQSSPSTTNQPATSDSGLVNEQALQ